FPMRSCASSIPGTSLWRRMPRKLPQPSANSSSADLATHHRRDTTMSLPIDGLAGDDLDLGDRALRAAQQLHRRQVSEEQLRMFEGYAAEIFPAFGLDLNTPATRDTPRRFIRALFDVTAGYDGDPKLVKAFETECRGEPDCRLSQVIEGPIPFFALCEHHAL